MSMNADGTPLAFGVIAAAFGVIPAAFSVMAGEAGHPRLAVLRWQDVGGRAKHGHDTEEVSRVTRRSPETILRYDRDYAALAI